MRHPHSNRSVAILAQDRKIWLKRQGLTCLGAMLSLQVILPSAPDVPTLLKVSEQSTGGELKNKVAELVGEQPVNLTLFARSMQGHSELRRIDHIATLAAQDVENDAIISCMVEQVVEESDCRKPDPKDDRVYHEYSSKYAAPEWDEIHDSADDCDPDQDQDDMLEVARLNAEDLVTAALDGVQNAEAAADHEDNRAAPVPLKLAGPTRCISTYSWTDKHSCIKVYISKDSEAEAVAAAGNGHEGQLEARFASRGATLVVNDQHLRHVLELRTLQAPIVPAQSRCMVLPGKRIALELHKRYVGQSWPMLLRPRTDNHSDSDA